MTDPFEAIRAHVEKHDGKERATFSVAGVKALLVAADTAKGLTAVAGQEDADVYRASEIAHPSPSPEQGEAAREPVECRHCLDGLGSYNCFCTGRSA